MRNLFYHISVFAFLVLTMCKREEGVVEGVLIPQSDQIQEPLIVAVHSLQVNANNSRELSGSSNNSKFDKLISSKNRKLVSTSEFLKFPWAITNNFYVANLDKNEKFDLVATALGQNGIRVFPDDDLGFVSQPEARDNIEAIFSDFLKTIKSGRVKTLDLREVYAPPEYYTELAENINVHKLEFDKSTFRLGKNGIQFSNGFSEIACENIIFDQYFFEAFSGNQAIRVISILNGTFAGAIASPLQQESSSIRWLDEFRRDGVSNFSNLFMIELNDSDPRILTALTWLPLPNLQHLKIVHTNTIFHYNIEYDLIQTVTCAVQNGSRWPNLKQISITYMEDHLDRYKKRKNIEHRIDSHLSYMIREFWEKNKINHVRMIELVVEHD